MGYLYLLHVSFRAHVKIASRIVSIRSPLWRLSSKAVISYSMPESIPPKRHVDRFIRFSTAQGNQGCDRRTHKPGLWYICDEMHQAPAGNIIPSASRKLHTEFRGANSAWTRVPCWCHGISTDLLPWLCARNNFAVISVTVPCSILSIALRSNEHRQM